MSSTTLRKFIREALDAELKRCRKCFMMKPSHQVSNYMGYCDACDDFRRREEKELGDPELRTSHTGRLISREEQVSSRNKPKW